MIKRKKSLDKTFLPPQKNFLDTESKVYPKLWDKYPKAWDKYFKAWDEYPKLWDIEKQWGKRTLYVVFGNFICRIIDILYYILLEKIVADSYYMLLGEL